MKLDPSVVLQVRRELRVLREEADRTIALLESVRSADDPATAQERAFDAAMALPELAGAGELASRDEAERDDLLRVTTDDAETRSWVSALVQRLLDARVFRAFAHVLPYSFRSPVLLAWARYRDHLKALLRQPMWGDGTPSLAQLYVPSPCNAGDGRRSEVLLDPLPRLLHWIDAPHPTIAVIHVTGEAGVGKSSLMTVLGARLADTTTLHPIALRAEALRDSYLKQGIEVALSGYDTHWLLSPSALTDRRWLLVDGIDEVAGADDLVIRVTREAHTMGFTGVVFAGRPDVTASQRSSSHVLNLRPFRAPQVSAWCERWKALEGREFQGHRFLEEETGAQESGGRTESVTPLLLFALAQVEREGYPLAPPDSERGRAGVYRDLMTWSCQRRAKALGDGASAFSLRQALRSVAEAHASPFELEPWTRPLEDRSLVASFPFLPGSAPAAFLHRSFGEYLAAESFALKCHRMTQPTEDVLSSDMHEFAPDLLTRWVEAAGTVDLTDETRRFLSVMLPDWEAFAQGKRRRRTDRIERWSAFEETLLHRFFHEDLAAACLPLLHRNVGRVDDIRARALSNYFAILSLSSAAHRRVDVPHGAEAMLPQFLGWISLGYSQVTNPVTRYLSLAGRSISVDLAQLDLMGIDLHDTDLDDCSLVGADLTDADLHGASMTFVDLTRASLRGANLRGADLRSATFRATLLDGADLTDAILTGVDTSAPEFARAKGL
jgi:hypothetical protein